MKLNSGDLCILLYKKIQFYYWPTPNCWKISIMLEELGVGYDLNYVNLVKGEQFKADFIKISPNNRIPAIVDLDGPNGQPLSIFESGAILLYLARKFKRFYPKDERERVCVEEWLMWQMAGLGPMSGQARHFLFYATEKLSYAIKRYICELQRLYGVMDKQLGKKEYLAGDYSIADIASIVWISNDVLDDKRIEDFPNLYRWWRILCERPAVKKCLDL
ncbi:MAG: glutathione S-transferase [Candidatus Tokpelaia sp. JSC161]|jgi:GST-like protein|nr:MAG: glutathione S-transferase [Candidatus Tokpelaia sp. JSC161]